MNTKISATDLARVEQMNIENKISIVRLSIEKYEVLLKMYGDGAKEEYMIKINDKLARERKELKKLKDKYPEHFI